MSSAYFFYGRDRAGATDLRRTTIEAHWSFMDGYVESMIARGPTLAADDESVMTGSMHIVDLPDRAAVETFAYTEPFYRAGVFGELLVRRFENTFGRTMWDFAGSDGPRFMVIGHGHRKTATFSAALQRQQSDYFADPARRDDVIVHGSLFSDDTDAWLGALALVQAESRVAAEALIAGSPHARAGLYDEVELHRWRFGGRPAA